MSHKCDRCFWKTNWNGGEYPICERLWYESFDAAKDECTIPGPCQYYMTDEEADEIGTSKILDSVCNILRSSSPIQQLASINNLDDIHN